MKDPKRILFIDQEMNPFLPEETPIRKMNRMLPQICAENGIETRTFMPKFGEINERRNQLHEVIRLSGMNLIIDDSDHPLLIKVTSIQQARIQIYFIDNDDYFKKRKGIADERGVEYADNDERCIFFARGVLETITKLRWTPDLIVCSGWMSALAPIYIRKAFTTTPIFENTKIVMAIDDRRYKAPFNLDFAKKILVDDMTPDMVSTIEGKAARFEDMMKLGMDYSDVILQAVPFIDSSLLSYAMNSGKPFINYLGEDAKSYLDFFKTLL